MRVHHLEQQGANQRAQQAKRQQELQQGFVKVAPERGHTQHVHQQQHRHQDRRRLRHGDRHGHHRHGQRAKPGTKTTFADAEQQHGRNGHGVESRVGDEGEVQGWGRSARRKTCNSKGAVQRQNFKPKSLLAHSC